MSEAYESFYEEITEGDYRFAAILFKLSNAVLVFFYDADSIKLGTLAVSMPQFGSEMSISSILLGDKNMILTKILAERISNTFKGIALVSTYFGEIYEAKRSATLFKLTQKLLEKACSK